jgi:hypothetical protein
MRGIGLPHCSQNAVLKRAASGTRYERSNDSPDVHSTRSGRMITLLAWPVPEALRHRRQWQWKKDRGSPEIL